MKNNKGFTLIELLMVCSIISLLASIILVSLGDTRKSAINAKSLQFDATIYHAIGYECIGAWSFNEGAGNIAKDINGSNNGILRNMESTDWQLASSDSDNTPSGKGSSLLLDGGPSGSNEGISVNTINKSSAALDSEVTVSFWAKSNGNFRGYALAKPTEAEGVYVLCYGIWFDQRTGVSAYFSTVINGNSSYKTYYILPTDSWTHVVSTFNDTTDTLKHYINGVEVSSWTVTLSIPSNTAYGLMIGARCSNSPPYSCNTPYWSFGGFLDEVKLYKESLSSSDVLRLYAEGIQRHLAKQ